MIKNYPQYLLLLILTLVVLLLACGSSELSSCGRVVISCPQPLGETLVVQSGRVQSQTVEGNIRYFTVYDCFSQQTFQSSTRSDCTLSVR